MRWHWVKFQCLGVLLIWILVGQVPTALALGAAWGCLDIFFSRLSFLSSYPSSKMHLGRKVLKCIQSNS